MAITKVVMPKLSEAMETGKIIKWLKKEGDRVQGGDILAEIETDKADVEMEAFGAGVLRKILVGPGERAPVGGLIGVIAEPNEAIASAIAGAPAARPGRAGPPGGSARPPGRPRRRRADRPAVHRRRARRRTARPPYHRSREVKILPRASRRRPRVPPAPGRVLSRRRPCAES